MSDYIKSASTLCGNPSCELQQVFSICDGPADATTFAQFLHRAEGLSNAVRSLHEAEAHVQPSDVLCLQFSSGTTGSPKVSMLTHK